MIILRKWLIISTAAILINTNVYAANHFDKKMGGFHPTFHQSFHPNINTNVHPNFHTNFHPVVHPNFHPSNIHPVVHPSFHTVPRPNFHTNVTHIPLHNNTLHPVNVNFHSHNNVVFPSANFHHLPGVAHPINNPIHLNHSLNHVFPHNKLQLHPHSGIPNMAVTNFNHQPFHAAAHNWNQHWNKWNHWYNWNNWHHYHYYNAALILPFLGYYAYSYYPYYYGDYFPYDYYSYSYYDYPTYFLSDENDSNYLSTEMSDATTKYSNETTQSTSISNTTWVAAKNGNVPENAVVNSNENNTPTYYCRAKLSSQTYYGVLVPKDACYIQEKDATLRFDSYEVMVTSSN